MTTHNSIRARGASREEALGQVVMEANGLGETLRSQRLGALEATTLLRKVMEEIDVAVFTFDEDQHLSLLNRGLLLKEYILAALELNGGNQTRTAEQLRIGSAMLYRKLKKYGSIEGKRGAPVGVRAKS